MELADKVRLRREQIGISQDELARRMGYKSRTSINKIENGRPVSQKIIVRLAEALNVPVAYLMDWEEKKEPTDLDDGLSENVMKLVEFARSVPEDKADMILKVMRSIVGDD